MKVVETFTVIMKGATVEDALFSPLFCATNGHNHLASTPTWRAILYGPTIVNLSHHRTMNYRPNQLKLKL